MPPRCTTAITTSCETVLKATLDIVEANNLTGTWEITKVSNNSGAYFKVGERWTLNNDLTYSKSTGESGKWMIKQSVLSFEKNGAAEAVFGTVQNTTKKSMEINVTGVSGYSGVITFQKVQ